MIFFSFCFILVSSNVSFTWLKELSFFFSCQFWDLFFESRKFSNFFILFSIQWFTEKHKQALFEALEKVKAGKEPSFLFQ